MKKFSFAFRTAFTKEKIIIEAIDYISARREFAKSVVNKRLPVKVYLDYVWELDDEGNPFQRVK